MRTGRPRVETDDPRLARRRAQYRNAKARAKGQAEEPVPRALDERWPGAGRVLILKDGRRVYW